MTQRTDIQSTAQTVISISATLPDTYDATGYSSTDIIWSPIGQPETFGNHGMTATVTAFTPVDTAVVAKIKGSRDYGLMSMMFGYVPGDAGQVILESAAESSNRYSIKVAYPLGNGEATAEVHYLDVLVSKKENQDGAVNDVRKLAVDLAICRKPVRVAAT